MGNDLSAGCGPSLMSNKEESEIFWTTKPNHGKVSTVTSSWTGDEV